MKKEFANRRNLLKTMAVLPVVTGTANAAQTIASSEAAPVDGVTGATRTTFVEPPRPRLKEKIPLSRIKERLVSRLILDGNWMLGRVHARDLIYVSRLYQQYTTPSKSFEIMFLAEQCGITSILCDASIAGMVPAFHQWGRGKIDLFAQCGDAENLMVQLQKMVDSGAVACVLDGEMTDLLIRENRWDLFPQALEFLRKNNVLAAIGAYRIASIEGLVAKGIVPDFWVKTYHSTEYWSAKATRENDSIFCRNPEQTREFMASCKEPWMAIHTDACGVFPPKAGFQNAFEGGADFVCAGMMDYNIVGRANDCVAVLNSLPNRTRPWATPTLDRKELLREQRQRSRSSQDT